MRRRTTRACYGSISNGSRDDISVAGKCGRSLCEQNFAARTGYPCRNDRPDPEIGSVRQPRHEPHRQQHTVIRSERRTEIPRHHQPRQCEQYLFQRPRMRHGDRQRRTDANPQRIGRDQMPRLRNGDVQSRSDERKNTHHAELGHPESQRTEGEGYQTLFHSETNFSGCKDSARRKWIERSNRIFPLLPKRK